MPIESVHILVPTLPPWKMRTKRVCWQNAECIQIAQSNNDMELAVIALIALCAFIAWAPKELTQVWLMLAWGGAALLVLIPIGQLLIRALS